MPHYAFLWDDRNEQHVRENNLEPADAEAAMRDPESEFISNSSGRPGVRGYDRSGQRIAVVYEEIDDLMVYIVTAYAI